MFTPPATQQVKPTVDDKNTASLAVSMMTEIRHALGKPCLIEWRLTKGHQSPNLFGFSNNEATCDAGNRTRLPLRKGSLDVGQSGGCGRDPAVAMSCEVLLYLDHAEALTLPVVAMASTKQRQLQSRESARAQPRSWRATNRVARRRRLRREDPTEWDKRQLKANDRNRET